MSEPLAVNRGIHQGGANSTNLFLVVAEILALNLRSNREIQGIPVNEIINLLSQFADDMDVAMLFDENSLNTTLNEITDFKSHTGFTINTSKTKILRVGALENTDFKLITQHQLSWTNEPINVLGVWVGTEDVTERNYKDLLPKIKATLSAWSSRGLSLIGKIQIINSFIGSLFVYKMMVLPSLPQKLISQIEAELNKFIWNGKKPKISLKVLQGNKWEGGLKLVHLREKDRALKASWVKIIQDDEKLANMAYQALSPQLGPWIFDCNLNFQDISHLQIKNKFWEDVLSAWSIYNYNKDVINDMIIWYNSLIRIDNKPVLWKKGLNKGLFRISQLYNEGKPISVEEAKTNFELNHIEYRSLLSAIPPAAREFLAKGKKLKVLESKYALALDKKNLSKEIYCQLIKSEKTLSSLEGKWKQALGHENISQKVLEQAFKNIDKSTNSSKLRSFQYRLLNRALVTNAHLYRWKIKESNNCTFCKKEKETIEHLYGHCDYTNQFLLDVIDLCKQYTTEPATFTVANLVLNKVFGRPMCVANTIILNAKQYIYRKKCKEEGLSISEFKKEIVNLESMEKYIAVKNDKFVKHLKKWGKHCSKATDVGEELGDYIAEYILNQTLAL